MPQTLSQPVRTDTQQRALADAIAHHRYCPKCGNRVGHWPGCWWAR